MASMLRPARVLFSQVRGVGGKKDTIFPPPRIRTIESEAQSLRDRSYLRPIKPYNPPADTEEKLRSIFNEHLGANSTTLSNGRIKFKVLSACNKEFDYAVPNSCLHKMNTIDDVRAFYLTTVDTRVPLDRFKSVELPPNLHIQYDYHRFHPETDTKFGGVTAFPRRSNIVTGLTYKKKYTGFEWKPKWK